MRSPVIRVGLLLCSILSGGASPVLGQGRDEGEKVVVRGAAPIQGGIPASRERALQQAFRMAVEQVAGVIVESETLVENMALFEDNILTRTEGYVRDYDIVYEGEEDGGVYSVEVEVTVVPGALSRDLQSLGILLKRADYPMVAVEMFASSTTELPPETGSRLEAEARAILRDRGLEVVQPNGRGVDPAVRIEGTLELADQGDAAGVGLESASAIISIQAIEEATGVVMATARGRSRGAGVSAASARDQAGVRAMEDALEELVDDLVEEWSDRVNNRDAVLVSLHGITDFEQVIWLTELILDEFGETEDVVQRQVDVDRGRAVLEWRGRSNARSLSIWLSRYPFSRYDVRVVGTGGNLIQLEFRAH
jgi:hypothetical protein